MAEETSPGSSGAISGTNEQSGLRLPKGKAGVALSLLLAAWATYSLPDSPLQAYAATVLAILLIATSLRDARFAASFEASADAGIERGTGLLSRPIAMDAALCLGVMLVAALPRLLELNDLPPGFHGDEAVAGIEARRILDTGPIGAYSREALGVPAGMFYWVAAVMSVAGESMFSVRLAFALVGIATVGMLYGAVRVAFDRQTGVLAALILAVMVWHVHFSRIALIPLGMPFFMTLTLLCSAMAYRTGSRWWTLAAGAALGGGLYTYQADVVFVLAFLLTAALLLICYRQKARLLSSHLALMLVVAVVAAVPLIRYAEANRDVVFGRFTTYSVFRSPEYKAESSLSGKILYLAEHERDFLKEALATPAIDAVDGAGAIRVIDVLALSLAILGLGIAVARIRSPIYLSLIALTVLTALSPMIVTEGLFRRGLNLAPLLAVLAALPLSLALNHARRYSPSWQAISKAGVATVLAAVAFLNLNPYFTTYDQHPAIERIFGYQIAAAFEEVQRRDDDVYVYFLSDSTTYFHPDRLFLAPSNPGEDRSERFGDVGFSLAADRSRRILFMLLDNYTKFGPSLQSLYPDGELVTGPERNGEVAYVAYYLSAIEPVDQESIDRDRRRLEDIEDIAGALYVVRQDEGAFPSTQDKVQTACRYEETDVLCRLKQAGIDVFEDPRGDSELYGYWYASDGQSFTLYAAFENPVPPSKQCSVAHLSKHADLYCLKSE